MKGGPMKTKGANFKARIPIYILFCGLIVFGSFQVFGGEWTAEQKEVWKAEETDAELKVKGDVKGMSALRHDYAVGWWYNRAVPFDDKNLMVRHKFWFAEDTPTRYNVEPLSIQTFGNVAVVYYMFNYRGKLYSGEGRTMETWIKQDNMWLNIGHFSASCDELPPCK